MNTSAQLDRNIGVFGLVATGISTMVGGAINVLPLMLHRSIPGIGPDIAWAYALASVPALLAALAYARLAMLMPQAGGSYIYVSRALHPYVGFVASFCQWFGFSIVTGVVAYLLVPFFRDFLLIAAPDAATGALDTDLVRVGIPLLMLWLFAGVNWLGGRVYARTLVPLTILMLVCSSVVLIAGFLYNHADFLRAVDTDIQLPSAVSDAPGGLAAWLPAAAILFASFIGFETIAQAGGEARNPTHTLPMAIIVAIAGVAVFYVAFTAAVYHTVPWPYAASVSMQTDLTVPGVMGYVLSPGWAGLIAAGAALGLMNHLPAMLMSVSRLLFAWAEDGLIPPVFRHLHPHRHTPDAALLLSTTVACLGVVGCHWAGDFFLGLDVLTTTMLVNFVLVCAALLVLSFRSARVAGAATLTGWGPRAIASAGILLLLPLLAFHIAKDLGHNALPWYMHSTWIFVIVLIPATAIFWLGRPRTAHTVTAPATVRPVDPARS